MTHALYKTTLTPHTAFASPLVGDMLFGQICSALAQRQGSDALTALLAGYTEGKPFAVISDAFPAGFLPKPRVPIAMVQALDSSLKNTDPTQRKAAKKKAWVPSASVFSSVAEAPSLIDLWRSASELPPAQRSKAAPETHNSINRLTSTTDATFTPYSVSNIWHGGALDLYCVLDTARFTAADLKAVLTDIGQWGYGKDATVGKGKFSVGKIESMQAPAPCTHPTSTPQPLWTLGACAPQGLGFDAQNSYYTPVTRYPRHGGEALHASPYKEPLLIADTAAVFATTSASTDSEAAPRLFIGQGLGGAANRMSLAAPHTVHQGYAPVIAIAC